MKYTIHLLGITWKIKSSLKVIRFQKYLGNYRNGTTRMGYYFKVENYNGTIEEMVSALADWGARLTFIR